MSTPEWLLEEAWNIIAAVGVHQGSWEAQHPTWVAEAERWRDRYHDHIGVGWTGWTYHNIPLRIPTDDPATQDAFHEAANVFIQGGSPNLSQLSTLARMFYDLMKIGVITTSPPRMGATHE